MYSTCVRSAMLHATECMALTKKDMDKIRKTDRAMIRWICRVKLKDRLRSDILLDRLRIPDITEVCRRNRLRWYGHVQRNTGWTKRCTELMIEGVSRRGGPRKKWQSLVDDDMKLMGRRIQHVIEVNGEGKYTNELPNQLPPNDNWIVKTSDSE